MTSSRFHTAFAILLLCFLSVFGSKRQTDAAMSDSDLTKLASENIDALIEAGQRAYDTGGYDDALKIFSVSAQMHDDKADRDTQLKFARAMVMYGEILYKKDAHAAAMENYLKARKIAEKFKDYDLLSDVFAGIGLIYASAADYANADKFFREGLLMDARSGTHRQKASLLNYLVGVNFILDRPDSASRYLNMYETLPRSLRGKRHAYDVNRGLGMIYESRGMTDSAIARYNAAARSAAADGLPVFCTGAAYSSLSSLYDRIGAYDSAMYYLEASERVARDMGSGRMLVQILRDKASIYSKMNMPQRALDHKVMYLNLADSLSFQEETDRLKNSQMVYELDSNATTIRGLNADKVLQRQWLLALGAALVVFALMALVLFRQKSKLKRMYSELYERNMRQLQDELSYKSRIKQLEEDIASASGGAAEDVREESSSDDDVGNEAGSSRKLISSETQRKKILRDILNIMENTDEYCSVDFSLDRLAAMIDSNARYVSEIINMEFKKNFRTFLSEYRIKKAMLRLSDTKGYGHYTIKAISESVGYKSQATFISAFTKYTGLKPSLYQKLASADNDESSTPFQEDDSGQE